MGPAAVLPPVSLITMTLLDLPFTAALSMLIIFLALLPFFTAFEKTRPRPRDLAPIAVMSALAALGRALFMAVPSFKPTSAIVIITGMQFGPQAGFLTGALSALASNMFLGQGPWTPWQMYAWGMIGFLAGILEKRRMFQKRWRLYVFGMLCGVLFGWFLNLQYIASYVNPVNLKAILLAYAAGFWMDITHGAATVIFLVVLEKPWGKKLARLKKKYGIGKESSNV